MRGIHISEIDIPEFFKDPKYFRRGLETTQEDDQAIVFPRIEDFNFDKEKYKKAIEFLRLASSKDATRKLT
jgi:hypothetical protein